VTARWHISEDPPAAAEAAAQQIIAILEGTLAELEFATLAVSGGSTPRLLFGRLAASRFPWNRIHLYWVDERMVPPDDPASNYKLAFDHLIKPAHIPPRQVHRIVGELPPKVAAGKYALEIRDTFGLDISELPRFDVVHCGMGPDAHTASLFPGEPLIDDREGIAAAVCAPQFNQWRVTLLPGVLLAARHTVFLVCGADKVDAVRAVFHQEYDPKKYPAQISTHQGRGVMWFLDRAAAEGVE
jgi:6-phosphogluconolactonase